MLEAINNWGDYRRKLREFDAVLEYGRAVCAGLTGPTAATYAGHGVPIFLRVLAHAAALRRLAADADQRAPQELWDVPSACAVARCVVEAHDAFEYVAGHAVPEEERDFRIQLWELHDQARRLKMAGEARPALRAELERLKAALQGHAFFAALPADLQAALRQRLARDDPPAFHLGLHQRCAMSGVDADWHQAVTMQLSQHAYTLPSSVHALSQARAQTPEQLRLVAMPLLYALPFLARVLHAVAVRLPREVPEPPSRTARTMAAWRAVAAPGPADSAAERASP